MHVFVTYSRHESPAFWMSAHHDSVVGLRRKKKATAVEERKGRADKGREKGEERVRKRKEAFANLRKQLEAAENAVEEQEKKCSQLHL